MRKTVLNSINVVSCNEVNVWKYYAAVSKNLIGGIITRDSYEQGLFKLRALRFLTNGNGMGYENPILQDLIIQLLNDDWTVFQFDTAREMFKWLAENTAILEEKKI